MSFVFPVGIEKAFPRASAPLSAAPLSDNSFLPFPIITQVGSQISQASNRDDKKPRSKSKIPLWMSKNKLTAEQTTLYREQIEKMGASCFKTLKAAYSALCDFASTCKAPFSPPCETTFSNEFGPDSKPWDPQRSVDGLYDQFLKEANASTPPTLQAYESYVNKAVEWDHPTHVYQAVDRLLKLPEFENSFHWPAHKTFLKHVENKKRDQAIEKRRLEETIPAPSLSRSKWMEKNKLTDTQVTLYHGFLKEARSSPYRTRSAAYKALCEFASTCKMPFTPPCKETFVKELDPNYTPLRGPQRSINELYDQLLEEANASNPPALKTYESYVNKAVEMNRGTHVYQAVERLLKLPEFRNSFNLPHSSTFLAHVKKKRDQEFAKRMREETTPSPTTQQKENPPGRSMPAQIGINAIRATSLFVPLQPQAEFAVSTDPSIGFSPPAALSDTERKRNPKRKPETNPLQNTEIKRAVLFPLAADSAPEFETEAVASPSVSNAEGGGDPLPADFFNFDEGASPSIGMLPPLLQNN